jgi:ATP-dependent helicase/nuclease subunit A
VRFVIDQARAWSEAGGHGVRRYLLWTRLQGDEGRFVAETVLPETDHDVVRIMTVHAAKGLEFPITVVSGLTARPQGARGKRVVWPAGTWALSTKDDPTYVQFAPVDEQMSNAERRRLLYVACTRAMDHLVVSLHRPDTTSASAAHDLATASEGATHRSFSATAATLLGSAPAATELPWADEGTWFATWQSDLAAASRPAALSATTLAGRLAGDADTAAAASADDGVRKDPVDLDLPPWQRGRYGTAVGRAVHAVLQFADLRTGANIPGLAAAQAAAEGVLGHERTIERLARSALRAPIVAQGIEGQHWRELFVATNRRHGGGGLHRPPGRRSGAGPGGGRLQDRPGGTRPRPCRSHSPLRPPTRRVRPRLGAVARQTSGGRVLVMCRPTGPAEHRDRRLAQPARLATHPIARQRLTPGGAGAQRQKPPQALHG